MKFFHHSEKNWFVETIEYFRSLNFFERYKQLSTAELAGIVSDWLKQDWDEELESPNILLELSLLSFDEDRVWWDDTEADVCRANLVYAKTLQAWRRISRGTFLPEEVEEHWETEEGPIEVSFTLTSQPVKLYPEYLEDYIDLNLLPQINKLIDKSNMQFELYQPFDQTGFVVVLTDQEKKMLQKKRSWRFAF